MIAELFRTPEAGRSPAASITPHEWEEHQQPHDYFRYTRYGIDYLLRALRIC